jgi:hypothetical protein
VSGAVVSKSADSPAGGQDQRQDDHHYGRGSPHVQPPWVALVTMPEYLNRCRQLVEAQSNSMAPLDAECATACVPRIGRACRRSSFWMDGMPPRPRKDYAEDGRRRSNMQEVTVLSAYG